MSVFTEFLIVIPAYRPPLPASREQLKTIQCLFFLHFMSHNGLKDVNTIIIACEDLMCLVFLHVTQRIDLLASVYSILYHHDE